MERGDPVKSGHYYQHSIGRIISTFDDYACLIRTTNDRGGD